MKQKRSQFVMTPHSLVKLGRNIRHQTFRLISYLQCFDPCFPSREQIKLEAGLTDAAITIGLKEAMALGILTYERGNSNGKANTYKVHPEKDWKLPEHPSYSKKRSTRNSNKDHSKNLGSSTPNTTTFVPQEELPNQSNSNYTNPKESNDSNQSGNNRLITANPEVLKHLTAVLHKHFRDLFSSAIGVKFDPAKEGALTQDELVIILERYISYCEAGGSLHGLIASEHNRLGGKKERRVPEPRFLAKANSRKVYIAEIAAEAYGEELETCLGPIGLKYIKAPMSSDRSYHLCRRAFKHLLKVKSIDQYVIDSLNPSNRLPLMGSYLFKYAVLKEYCFDQPRDVTQRACKLYFKLIGNEQYNPFWFQMAPNAFDSSCEGWPHLGIARGSALVKHTSSETNQNNSIH